MSQNSDSMVPTLQKILMFGVGIVLAYFLWNNWLVDTEIFQSSAGETATEQSEDSESSESSEDDDKSDDEDKDEDSDSDESNDDKMEKEDDSSTSSDSDDDDKMEKEDDSTEDNDEDSDESDDVDPDAQLKEGTTYTVVAGDTLWEISQRLGRDGNEYPLLVEKNNIENPDLILIGQVLEL